MAAPAASLGCLAVAIEQRVKTADNDGEDEAPLLEDGGGEQGACVGQDASPTKGASRSGMVNTASS